MISPDVIADRVKNGAGIIVCGNGGSMAQAQHLAAEIVGLGYPAMALSDPAVLSALYNDHGPDSVFARYLRAFSGRFELFIGLTTSGSSNVFLAAFHAHSMDMKTVMITGDIAASAPHWLDLHIKFEGDTQEIQEQTLEWIHEVYANLQEERSWK